MPTPTEDVDVYDHPPLLRSQTIAVNTILISLASFMVMARVYTKRYILGQCGWDDCISNLLIC